MQEIVQVWSYTHYIHDLQQNHTLFSVIHSYTKPLSNQSREYSRLITERFSEVNCFRCQGESNRGRLHIS